MIRDLVLTVTILSIIFMAVHQPRPSRMVETPYCVVDRLIGSKELAIKDGKPVLEWKFEWGEVYAPCSQQDRFKDA